MPSFNVRLFEVRPTTPPTPSVEAAGFAVEAESASAARDIARSRLEHDFGYKKIRSVSCGPSGLVATVEKES